MHHTWQRAHSSSLRFPHPGSGPCGFGPGGPASLCQDGPTCAPPPGGRQVHCAGPRPADREGAIITRPEGPPPHAPFIPANARPGPRRSLPPPARSLARVGGGPGVQRPGPAGRWWGRRGSAAAPPSSPWHRPRVGRPDGEGLDPEPRSGHGAGAASAEGRFVDGPTGTSRPNNPRPAGQAASTACPGRE